MNKKYFFLILIIVLSSVSTFPQENDTTLQNLIKKAIKVSPKLQALHDKQNLSRVKIPQVSNLPDPMLTFGLMNLPVNSFSFTDEPMTAKIFGLSQAIPFPGKLNSAAEVQSKDIDINQQEIDDARNDIANDVRKIYFDLRFIREAIRIAKKNKEILEQIAEVVRTKYTVSSASQQHLIQIEVEITKIKDKIEDLIGKVNASLSALNSYLLQEPETPLTTELIPSFLHQDLNFSNLRIYTIENRPFLKGLKLAEEKASLMENLAEYDYYPNFNFSFQYSQRDELGKTKTPLVDFFSFMIGLNLPLNYGGKTSSKVEETKIAQKYYANQYESALQMLDKNIGISLSNLNAFQKREKLIREGLLPQAEQSLKAALAGYQVGNTDFINVLDTQNKLFEIETNLYSIRTMYFKELSQLEFLTGKNAYNY